MNTRQICIQLIVIINISHYYVEKEVITMSASFARRRCVLIFIEQKRLIKWCMLGIV